MTAPSPKEALERSIVAIDDWLNVYASELCNQDRVDEANHRISNAGGTLAYIANVQQQNRAALATLQPSGERREAIARMRRSLDQWAGCSPEAISKGSEAQMAYFVADAKHDIALLASGLVQDEAGIRADERENCAKIADREAEFWQDAEASSARIVAAAIRSARDGGKDQ